MNWNSFFDSIAKSRDEMLIAINPSHAIPSTRSLVILRNDPGNQNNYISVLPFPVIEETYPNSDSYRGVSSITGAAGDFIVKGLSKTIPRSVLETQGTEYFVDGKVENGIVEGKRCTLLSLSEKATTWELRLQYRINDLGVEQVDYY